MTDRPINLRPHQVRAALEGRLSQMRMVLKVQPPEGAELVDAEGPNTGGIFTFRAGGLFMSVAARYRPGDRLWCREAHELLPATAYRRSIGTGTIAQVEHPTDGYTAAVMREGFDRAGRPRWRPSTQMPRWASRFTLVVTDVHVHRLQDMDEGDAVAEGFPPGRELPCGAPSHEAGDLFNDFWAELHGPDSWDENPWVCAVSFRVERKNIDRLGAQT